ncbi:MAG TPA: integrin alpha, partial [Solirubrobacteraceae bacterium]|nr:integrin alpha [Solirubrobacteraceae bacterium]
MNVIRRLGTLACCSAAFVAAAPATAAELPVSGTLDLEGQGDARITGESFGSRAGWVVENAGDFNGDGVADVLIGAPNHDHPGGTDAGAVYVVMGPREGLPESLGAAGPRRLKLVGAEAGDRLGSAAAAAGDVNGDGLADVIVGAPVDVDGDGIGETITGERRREPRSGSAYLILGRRDGAALDGGTSAPGVIRLHTQTPDDRVGSDVGSVPDMDG